MIILKYTTLTVWTLVTLTNAQLPVDLPGVEEKPGDSSALDTLLACDEATRVLFAIPEVSTALATLQANVMAKVDNGEAGSCETKDETSVCTLDYGSIESDFRTVCEANGGIFDERDHQISCNDSSFKGTIVYLFTNYATCFSNTCQESDIERWIAKDVDGLEFLVEWDTSWICDSDYTIEETVAPQVSSGTCPNQKDNTPENCQQLSSQIQGQQCDCYAFCDGVLVECEKFNSQGASDVFCAGELVMGCTASLFNQNESSERAHVATSIVTIVPLLAALLL